MRTVVGFAIRVLKWWILPLVGLGIALLAAVSYCLLYTSDAADE